MMAAPELSGKEALDYFLKHFEFYDSVIILSYTPSILLREEQKIDVKRRFTDALLKRLRAAKGKTTIYASESGIEQRGLKDRESKKSNLQLWDELVGISKKHPDKLRIKVVKDEQLPCVSFILGHVPEKPWGPRAPWDLLVEYRVGIKPEQLFATGEEEGDSSKYEYHVISGDLPAGIRWILDKLELQFSLDDFESWINDSCIRYAPVPPELAVLSAMPIEVQFYRKGLDEELANDREGNQQGRIYTGKRYREIIFPPTNYGRYKTFETMVSVCSKFPSVSKFFFVGCAGGNPEYVTVGDVAISTEIVELIHEKALSKKDAKGLHGTRITGELIDLSSDTQLEMRTESHYVSAGLQKSAKGLADKSKQKRWKELIEKYLSYCPDSHWKKTLLSKTPKIVTKRIWSSDHNVNNRDFRNELTKKFGVVAFEMEGGGFATGARAFDREFIEIRGISDDADGHREDDILQPLALATASACLEALLLDIL